MPARKYTLNLRHEMSDLNKLHDFLQSVSECLCISKKCLLETTLVLEEIFSRAPGAGAGRNPPGCHRDAVGLPDHARGGGRRVGRRQVVERRGPAWITPRRGKDARCPSCGGELEKIRVSGRSAYYCPKDQRG